MATPPARIDKYELIRRLGHGGMGTVYLARDPDLDRLVAIKVLRDPLFDEELLERFFREARAAAKLRHANLITIYDVGQHDHQPFMAMEYVDGTTLAAVIAERQPLPLVEKLSYIEQICSGLHYAHCEGIIHRDVKPANLMLDRHRVTRILDFGIARIEGSGMTQEGAMLGTLSYMAPEQMLGRSVDFRSDIFAVGAVAYELLAYQKAFNLEAELRPRLPGDAPSPLSQCCAGLPPGLDEIVMRALASRPEDRFADLEEARAAFRDLRHRIDPELQLETMPPRSRARAPGGTGALTPSGSAPATVLLPRPTPRGRDAGFEPTLPRPAARATATPAVVVPTVGPSPGPSSWPRLALAASGIALLGAIVIGVSWWRAGDENAASSTAPTETRASTADSPRAPTETATPAAPIETPPVPSSVVPNLAGAALQARLDRITATYRSGDLSRALEDIAPTLATSDDDRVRQLAKTIATAAYQMMTGAARAAGAQNASTLSPGPFGAAERSKRLADDAQTRTDYVSAGRYALAAADNYRRAEKEALSAASPTVRSPEPVTIANAPAPTPDSAPTPAPVAAAPPAAPPPPVASPAVPAAPSPASPSPATLAFDAERPGIMGALGRYQEAYRQRSVELLRKVYPSLPRETGQRLDRSFNNCLAYDVTFLSPTVALGLMTRRRRRSMYGRPTPASPSRANRSRRQRCRKYFSSRNSAASGSSIALASWIPGDDSP